MPSVPGWMPQILTSARKQSPSFLAKQKSSGQVERHRFAGCGFAASEAGGLERLIHPQSFEVIRGASTHENEIERRRSRWYHGMLAYVLIFVVNNYILLKNKVLIYFMAPHQVS